MNEASIRDWVRYDAEVAKVIKEVGKKRLEFVTIGFERAGFDPVKAKENTTTRYAALIGLDYLANHVMADIKKDLLRVLNTLLQSKAK